MPELPEVETVRRGLEKLLLGRTILSLEVKVPKMIKTSYDSFLHDLPGQTIQAMRRRGKYLIFDFGQLIIISHLRMEGKYLLFTDQVPDNIYWIGNKKRPILQGKNLALSLPRRPLNMYRLREP